MHYSLRHALIAALLLPGSWLAAPSPTSALTSTASYAQSSLVARQAASRLPVAAPFAEYYGQRQGFRVLGGPRTGLLQVPDTAAAERLLYAQIFEKGRIEYHPEEQTNLAWRFAYGRLAATLIEQGATLPVGGDRSSVSYRDLQAAIAPERREQPPVPSAGGPIDAGERGIFVPVNEALDFGNGHYVARPFWEYINRQDLFPGGWLHDVGLPLSAVIEAQVTKGSATRTITLQVFERAILTNDPQNPADFRIERANVGSDYLTAFPFGAEDRAINAAIQAELGTPPAFVSQIQRVENDVARVLMLPTTGADRESTWLYLRKIEGRWRPLAGLVKNPGDDFYNEFKIPSQLRVGNELERSLETSALSYARSTIEPRLGLKDTSVRIDRIAGGFAKVDVLESDGSTAVEMFARLDDFNRWTILGTPDTPEQIELGVPDMLRTFAG